MSLKKEHSLKGTIVEGELAGLDKKYTSIPAKPQKTNWVRNMQRLLRNILSILLGLIIYAIMEILLSNIFLFLLKIPVLSLLMTGFIPADIFLSASVASGATFATFYSIKFISSYKSTNYSVVIVFSILLLIYIVSFIYKVSTIGFNFTQLTSALIFIGSFIFGCFTASKEAE